jgi:uncharacterized protein YqeY
MTSTEPVPVRAALKAAVTAAMKQRDREALSVYRTALAAIDNAEAITVDTGPKAGAIELSPVGVGRGEVERRFLGEQQMVDVVRREAQDRLDTAESLASSNPDAAARLRHEASLLAGMVDQ